MTCIVGVIEKEKIYIGADSAGVAGLDVTIRKDPKVFKVGDFLIGCTSSFRMIQLIMFKFNPPKMFPSADVFKYMCTDFIDELRICLKNGGYASVSSNVERGGCFIVGYEKRLFIIDSDFQVEESVDSFASVGCGYAYAYGALHALSDSTLNANDKIQKVLEIATYRSGGVRPPFTILSI